MSIRGRIFFIILSCLFIGLSLAFVVADRDLSEGLQQQIEREPYSLPTIQITERNWYQHEKVKEQLGPKTFRDIILSYRPDCFELIGYESHPKIKAPLSN